MAFAVLLLTATVATAQTISPHPPASRPELEAAFDRMLSLGERSQLPWEVKLASPRLRLDQRLEAVIDVELSNATLNRHAAQHDLILMVRMSQHDGDWLPGHSRLAKQLDQPLPARTTLVFTVRALVVPGNYRVGVLLFDRLSGHSSVALRPLRVDPPVPEPLPQAFRQLPPVEFIHSQKSLDDVMLPDLQGRLWLPIKTQRPLHLELLVNFSHSEEFMGRGRSPRLDWWSGLRWRWPRIGRRARPKADDNLAMILSALKPLAEMAVSNGSLRVTTLDLSNRKILFEQRDPTPLDWPTLRDALSQFNSNVVTADALAGGKESPAFLREVLHQRLAPAKAAAQESASCPVVQAPPADAVVEPPLRVMIVLSSAMLFVSGSEVSPVNPPQNCNCRVYYLRLRMLGNVWDQIDDVLDPLKPRRFDIGSPADYRSAIAAILNDLRTL
ncbi:MAG: hypothetical protein ACRD6I_00905 [Candidatus Acidiferrales bacterium]